MPTAFAASQPLQGCQANRNENRDNFINSGRGGIPPNTYETLDSSNMFVDVQLPSQWSDRATTN